jgi:hypothetical protein
VALLSSAVFGFVRHPESELVTNLKKKINKHIFRRDLLLWKKTKYKIKVQQFSRKKSLFPRNDVCKFLLEVVD